MKTVILVVEGAAGEPVEVLGGRTPMQSARAHHASRAAQSGWCGVVQPPSTRAAWRPETVLALMSGMPDRQAGELRRGPVEAVGVFSDAPGPEMIFRGDFLTLDAGGAVDGRATGLTWEETQELADALHQGMVPEGFDTAATAPGNVAVRVAGGHELAAGFDAAFPERGVEVTRSVPKGKAELKVRRYLERAAEVLAAHPVNDVRVDLGENPANGIWLWGGGQALAPPAGPEPRETRGALASSARMGKGIASLCALEVLQIRSPWRREPDEAVWSIPDLIDCLRRVDRLTIYVEAPQEGVGFGDDVEKVRALDLLDQVVLGPLYEIVREGFRPCRLVLTVTGAPLPVALPVVVSGDELEPDAAGRWDEEACHGGGLGSMHLLDFPEMVCERRSWHLL